MKHGSPQVITKQELIDQMLTAMRNSPYSNDAEHAGGQDGVDYDAIVLATLNERLPEGDIKTCEDLSIDVQCCDICHSVYPHYDMYVEDLPDGSKAWICCRVRSALRDPGQPQEIQEDQWGDLEEALGGRARRQKRNINSPSERRKGKE